MSRLTELVASIRRDCAERHKDCTLELCDYPDVTAARVLALCDAVEAGALTPEERKQVKLIASLNDSVGINQRGVNFLLSVIDRLAPEVDRG